MTRPARVLAMVLALVALTGVRSPATQQSEDRGENIVLITLDGARTEEMFGGLDLDVLKSTLNGPHLLERNAAYQKYWAASPEERRRRLMPFFWRLVTEQGSIAGNDRLGSSVRLGNQHWFSYPGYAEILLGEPHDDVIKSNEPLRNPYVTVLETLRS